MAELPDEVVDEIERLTRLARAAVDDAEGDAYRSKRDDLLGEYDYTARVREDDDAAVLVCYPSDWVEDGLVRPDRIDDVGQGVQRQLSGTGDASDWEAVAQHNEELVERVADAHGEVHATNVRALADFANNHYSKPVERLTREELREFLDEYFPRNAWPTDRQRECVEDSLRFVFQKTDARFPFDG